MSKLNLLKKVVLVAMIAALGLAALPVAPAYAQGEQPQPQRQVSDEKLAEMWTRMVAAYERQGKLLENADAMIEKVQALIDKANGMGYDTGAVQAALDAFADATRAAWPVHQSANGIVNSHQGFDGNGQVTDRAQAVATLQELGAKLKEVRATMNGTGQALREALRAFRDAHRPAQNPES